MYVLTFFNKSALPKAITHNLNLWVFKLFFTYMFLFNLFKHIDFPSSLPFCLVCKLICTSAIAHISLLKFPWISFEAFLRNKIFLMYALIYLYLSGIHSYCNIFICRICSNCNYRPCTWHSYTKHNFLLS